VAQTYTEDKNMISAYFNQERNMYEFTQKALDLPVIIVMHCETGDELMDGYESKEEAIACARGDMCDDEWGEGDSCFVEYSLDEVEEAQKCGFGWPEALGLMEEEEGEEDENDFI
jgi:hypothetical protein